MGLNMLNLCGWNAMFLVLIGIRATKVAPKKMARAMKFAKSPAPSTTPSSLYPSLAATSIYPSLVSTDNSSIFLPVVSCLGTACYVEMLDNGTEVSNCPPGFSCELQTVLPSDNVTSVNSTTNVDASLSIQFSCVGYPANITEDTNTTWDYDLSQPPCTCSAQWIGSQSCQCQGCPGSTFGMAMSSGEISFLITCLDADSDNASVVINECPVLPTSQTNSSNEPSSSLMNLIRSPAPSTTPSSLYPSLAATSIYPSLVSTDNSSIFLPVVSCLGTACYVEMLDNGTEVSNCPPGFSCELQTVLPSDNVTSVNSTTDVEASLSIQFSCVGYPANITEDTNTTWDYDLSQPPCTCSAQWIGSQSCQCQGCPGSTFGMAMSSGEISFLITCLDADSDNASVVINECPVLPTSQANSSNQPSATPTLSSTMPFLLPTGPPRKILKPVFQSNTPTSFATNKEVEVSQLNDQSTSGTPRAIVKGSFYMTILAVIILR